NLKQGDKNELLYHLKNEAEKAKCALSNEKLTVEEINLPFLYANEHGKPVHFTTKLHRSDLEAITEDVLQKLVEPCRKCIKDSGKSLKEIDKVILVGGMTRMLAVQRKVKEIFEKEPNRSSNPDESIAIGAAIQAGMLTGQTNMTLLDVLSL